MNDDNKNYPLYPQLTEQGKEEAQKIMDSFKPRIAELISDVMDDLYADVSCYIESDHWTNYRNKLMDGFKGYTNGTTNHQYDYKELRQSIYKNHKEQIVNDLNNDLLEENKKLEKRIEELERQMQNAYQQTY